MSSLFCFPASAFTQQAHPTDDVHWCSTILVPGVWREARLTAIFTLDVDAKGKPNHVKAIKIPFVTEDEPFLSCISGWSLPSVSGKATVALHWEWGCKSIDISAPQSHLSFPCQSSKPGQQPDSHQP
jgi:hypothetical protein